VEDYLAGEEASTIKHEYLQEIETLQDYLVVAQDRVEVTSFRRSRAWDPELLSHLNQALSIPSFDLVLPLASVYEGVLGAD